MEPEEILQEIGQKLLDLAAEPFASPSALKKMLFLQPTSRSLREEVGALPLRLDTQSLQTSKAPKEQPETEPIDSGAASPLLRELRECQKRFGRKADEAEKLRVGLKKAQDALRKAQLDKSKALEEAAHLRKALAQLAEERDRLSAELVKLREESQSLRAAKASLEEQARRHKAQLDALEAQVRELEDLAKQKEQLEAQLLRLNACKEALPEPFPPEALLRVLVLNYPSLGGEPARRVGSLIEGYQALLAGKNHPALYHSNLELLSGEPEGVVLLGLERLLLDLASLPVARWLRAHAFLLESKLLEGQQPFSPRLREE